MPTRYAPSKVRTITFLTHLERSQVEMAAKLTQMTVSEWLRQSAIESIARHNQGSQLPKASATPIEAPRARQLLDDFIIGDINEDNE